MTAVKRLIVTIAVTAVIVAKVAVIVVKAVVIVAKVVAAPVVQKIAHKAHLPHLPPNNLKA
jgi:hypothetical protein